MDRQSRMSSGKYPWRNSILHIGDMLVLFGYFANLRLDFLALDFWRGPLCFDLARIHKAFGLVLGGFWSIQRTFNKLSRHKQF